MGDELIRCKDCVHRPYEDSAGDILTRIIPNSPHRFWRDHTCPCYCGDSFYAFVPSDDFFCGYGENEEGENNGCHVTE